MGQYWLSKRKPKKLSDRPEMLSKNYHRILKISYLTEFSTDYTNCLMPSDQRNSIMVKINFFTVRCRFSPRGAFWHTAVCSMHSSGTYTPQSSFVFHSSLLTVNSINLVVTCDGFLCVMEIIPSELSVFFIVATGAFQSVIDLYCCVTS